MIYMEEAMFWEPSRDNAIRCRLCPNNCHINEGSYGSCRVRKNIGGKLYSMNYGRVIGLSVDSIEKKPLYHFYPGSKALSIASVGCNFHCSFCQNWEISQPEKIVGKDMSPEEIIDMALSEGVRSIAYTYTEPTIFFEFMLDVARLAKEKGIRNVIVSNGYICREPLEMLMPYIDAANIDLKSVKDGFYRDLCGARGVKHVLDTIRLLAERGVHVEVTNLLVTGWNTDSNQIEEFCRWISDLDARVPLYLSRYFPAYRMKEEKTPLEVIEKAYGIAKDAGLINVYTGNVEDAHADTYCNSCGKMLIRREGLSVMEDHTDGGGCPKCRNVQYGKYE